MPKKEYLVLFLLLVCSFLAPIRAFSQSEGVLRIVPASEDKFFYPIARYLTVLPDPSGALKVEDVADPRSALLFKRDPNWLNSSIKTHWLRLEVKSDLPDDRQLLSYIQGSTVELYERDESGSFVRRYSGLMVPIAERDQKSRFGHLPYISLLVKNNAAQTYYWRVSTDNFPALSPHTNQPASIASYEYVLDHGRTALFFFIGLCSILFGLALYHFVIYAITRDRVYLYFTLYSLSACLYIMYYKGYLLELVFPLNPALHYSVAFGVTCIAFHIALLIYVRKYVDVPRDFPVWDKILGVVFAVVVMVIAIASVSDARVWASLLSYVLMAPVILLEALGVAMLIRKHPLAPTYLAAFTVLSAGFVINGICTITGVEQGIWDFGDLGLLGLQILLAVGLALRINLLNKEKQMAQLELINQLRANQLLQETATAGLEEKVAERTEEIELQNAKLTRLNLLKDKLFSIISHDIKGPLNQLSSTLFMMERDMITREEIKQLIPQIRTNLSANSNFISELLTWAKSQLEGAQLNPQSANLQDLIESNFQLLKPIADAKGIQLKSHLNNPLSIYADVEMIKSVVRNLSANAIKFTNPKGVIQINVGVDTDLSFASISIQDNGKGISTENQKKLFGTQIFTTPGTANEKGTGIGLLLCKDFVEKNGGKIWVESEEGKGSKFAFTVPLSKN